MEKKIGIASDHAGYEMKEFLVGYLAAKGWDVLDFGPESEESVDYPDFAHPLRQHNNANVIVLPARFITNDQAVEFVEEFLATDFEGGRHQRRIEKIPVKACNRQ